ncbi:MAG: family 78 glycoside hydrolase catalytic domain [Chitinophagaceae bacterium]
MNMKRFRIILLVTVLAFVCASGASAQRLRVHDLHCEYRPSKPGVETQQPVLGWQLSSDLPEVTQQCYRILVASDSVLLRKNTGDLWNSGKVFSAASFQLKYGGKKLAAGRTYFWRVEVWSNKGDRAVSSIARWQMGLFGHGDWGKARWIGYDTLPAEKKIIPAEHGKGKVALNNRRNVLPLLRKTFTVNKKLIRATAFVSGLGQFEMYVNGEKTGDHFLDPGWTRYDKEALYVPFDVTEQLQKGKNAIGIMLGNGFYYGTAERYRKLTGAYGYPKLKFLLRMEFTDGTTDFIPSDNSWKAAPGPVVFSSIYGGEDYDARLYPKGWDTPYFDDAGWKKAVVSNDTVRLYAQYADPVRVMDSFKPIHQTEPEPGVLVFDMQQNASAIPRITVTGKNGDSIRIIPGELLDSNGRVTQKQTGSPSFFTYILKGGSEEIWSPKFTYYGFRYLQVEGARLKENTVNNDLPVLKNIESLHIRNAAPDAGSFHSSSALFNQTYSLVDWAVRSNMVSIFTDCPHRERLGWLEQLHLMGSSVKYAYAAAPLFRKMLADMRTAQTPEGLIPSIAPEFTEMHFTNGVFRDSPEWGSAGIILPWYLYTWYGDKRALEENYPMMQRYLQHLKSRDTGRILMHGLSDWYDIGPDRSGFSQLTPQGLTATATYFYDLSIMQKIASLLGKPEGASHYGRWASEVRNAFNERFYDIDKKYFGSGGQTSNAIAVYMGLADSIQKENAIAQLVKNIRENGFRITAGDVGYRYVLRVLEEAGRSDIIYLMNNRSDVPGYGYQIAKGATALTESWVASPLVSNNHFMLGHIWEWFYSGLGGICQREGVPPQEGYILAPETVDSLSFVTVKYHSPYGVFHSHWNRRQDTLTLTFTIPANAHAEIRLPVKNSAYVRETVNGSKVSEDKKRGDNDGFIWLRRGSGNYSFKIFGYE